MKKVHAHGLTALAAVLLGGCAAGFDATTDHDPQQDFSGYRTFAWISEHPMKISESSTPPNPLLEGHVMAAIGDSLAMKGYRLIDEGETADFSISFTVGSREKVSINSYPSMSSSYGGYPSHWRWGGSYYGGTRTSVYQYTQGKLAIDIFDVADRRPVWHGIATKSITNTDRKNAEKTVRAAVDAVLSDFPPE